MVGFGAGVEEGVLGGGSVVDGSADVVECEHVFAMGLLFDSFIDESVAADKVPHLISSFFIRL